MAPLSGVLESIRLDELQFPTCPCRHSVATDCIRGWKHTCEWLILKHIGRVSRQNSEQCCNLESFSTDHCNPKCFLMTAIMKHSEIFKKSSCLALIRRKIVVFWSKFSQKLCFAFTSTLFRSRQSLRFSNFFWDIPGGPKKNVPNFAQVFSRSLSRCEGDILQVY